MSEHLIEHLNEAIPVLKDFIGEDKPLCAIILGSGLNEFANSLTDIRFLAYKEVPHMKVSTATGHVGRFVLGTLPRVGARVLCMQGRLHGYEGNSSQEVAFPVWLMQACGIDTLVITNAAGAINPSYRVGDFCMMRDQINFTGRSPLTGVEPNMIAERFVPMKDAFDAQLRKVVAETARVEGVRVHEGVYLGDAGPAFETPAEVKMYGLWGADTVAMSVCEEVIAARHVGMRVFGMSLITNMACGVEGGDPNSCDIMEVATFAQERFAKLMRGLVGYLAENR